MTGGYRGFANPAFKEVFNMTLKKAAAPKKPNYRLDLTKIAQFSLIQHRTQSEPNAGDLNERERFLRVGVGCVYPPVGIVSLIRAHNRGIHSSAGSARITITFFLAQDLGTNTLAEVPAFVASFSSIEYPDMVNVCFSITVL